MCDPNNIDVAAAWFVEPNRSPTKRVRFGKEEQRRERTLTFVKKVGASDTKLAPTWRSGWDSNPRAIARKLISSHLERNINEN